LHSIMLAIYTIIPHRFSWTGILLMNYLRESDLVSAIFESLAVEHMFTYLLSQMVTYLFVIGALES